MYEVTTAKWLIPQSYDAGLHLNCSVWFGIGQLKGSFIN